MITATASDPFAAFKAAQREGWALFAPASAFTAPPAADLVSFAGVATGHRVLDVGTGTGVAAITAARRGATVAALDLSPVLLDQARQSAALAKVDVSFTEGDVERLPYADASFDVVLSQFGHMFAPRPEVATAELLRVAKPGGRVAFATWPPEHAMGRLFALVARRVSAPGGAARPSPVERWGDPGFVREQLGNAVTELAFDRGVMRVPALSPDHVRVALEATLGPLASIVRSLASSPDELAQLRGEVTRLVAESTRGNVFEQHFLLTRATKRG